MAGGGAQGAHAALHIGDLLFHRVYSGVADAGIKVAAGAQIEQGADVGGFVVFKGCGLVDGKGARLPVFRLVAGVDAFGLHFHWVFPPFLNYL